MKLSDPIFGVILLILTGAILILAVNVLPASSSDNSGEEASVAYNFADNGKTMTVKRNTIFEIDLEENPTTGYSWNITAPAGLKSLGDTYNKDSELMGAGGVHSWKYKAENAGVYKFSGIYRRPWETTADDKTFDITIKVIE
jgi:inhibitor of cysteine peptidase